MLQEDVLIKNKIGEISMHQLGYKERRNYPGSHNIPIKI